MPFREARVAFAGVGAIAAGLTLAACAGPTRAGTPAPSATSAPTDGSSDDAETSSDYLDGNYEARGWYGGLPSHHDVTLTIEDDVITDVTITTPAEDATSLGYQQRFAEALPTAVVGRPIDELDVDRLAGSSGCSEGFMDALAKIRELARA